MLVEISDDIIDEVVINGLIKTYEYNKGDSGEFKKVLDAICVVLDYYMTPDQFQKFKDTVQ